uniref:Uncharacterized protein LOC114332602 n=1 Tax=Diabrotica virgifera virgifera TaxID=50390 RepID=A0A6P7FTU3_DIAVI
MAGNMEMIEYTVEYLYDGFLYKVHTTEEIHQQFDDTEFFLNYIKENSNSIEIKPEEEKPETIVPVPENAKAFSWNSENTKLLITEYGKNISEFRDPKIKKKSVWGKIKQVFRKMDYAVCEDDLDRKMRNLKHHYKNIKDNNKKSKTGRGRIVWEYFDLFEEVFADDKTINHGRIISSLNLPSTSGAKPNTGVAVAPNVLGSKVSNMIHTVAVAPHVLGSSVSNMVHTVAPEVLLGSPSTSSGMKPKEVATPTKQTSKPKAGRGLYKFRKEYLELEKRKIIALEQLVKEIAESNRIQRDRDSLQKEKKAE